MRVVVTDQVFGGIDIERSLLEPLGVELVEAPSADEDTLVALAEQADALLVCFATVSARVVEAAARGGCRVISRYGVGVDNIDLDAAARAGIPVTNVPDYCLDEVADHTMALLLASARELAPAAQSVRERTLSVQGLSPPPQFPASWCSAESVRLQADCVCSLGGWTSSPKVTGSMRPADRPRLRAVRHQRHRTQPRRRRPRAAPTRRRSRHLGSQRARRRASRQVD